jgi:hypothetical protein
MGQPVRRVSSSSSSSRFGGLLPPHRRRPPAFEEHPEYYHGGACDKPITASSISPRSAGDPSQERWIRAKSRRVGSSGERASDPLGGCPSAHHGTAARWHLAALGPLGSPLASSKATQGILPSHARAQTNLFESSEQFGKQENLVSCVRPM